MCHFLEIDTQKLNGTLFFYCGQQLDIKIRSYSYDWWTRTHGTDNYPCNRPYYFGAGKLPEIGAGLGKGIMNFKNATKSPKAEDTESDKEPEKIEKKD
jgi:hypothetical protein